MHYFDLLQYGNIIRLDLHGLSEQQAKYEISNLLNTIDSCYAGVEIVHGFHSGTVLKSMVQSYKHDLIREKIKIDASRTLFIFNWDK